MSRKKESAWGIIGSVLLVVLVLALIVGISTAGTYFLLRYLEGPTHREGFGPEDLRAPLPATATPWKEAPPVNITGGPSPNIYGKIARQVNATEGLGAILNISMKNEGARSVYVETITIGSGWGEVARNEVGRYVRPDEEVHLLTAHVPIPSPPPLMSERTMTIRGDLLIEDMSSWVRRADRELTSPFDVEINPLMETDPDFDIELNYYRWFDRVNGLIEGDIDFIGSFLDEGVPGWRDGYDIQRVVSAFEYMNSEIDYIPDPGSGSDDWYSPEECVMRGGGDCEDYSMLYAGMITAMGGSARVVLTETHAFCMVYIGPSDVILEGINDRFGVDLPLQVWEDELGKWLVVEPQSKFTFGWFPVGVYPSNTPNNSMYIYGQTSNYWGFQDIENIYVLDIYFN